MNYRIGVDEAGRGCLFGTVDVCAVCILDASKDPHLLGGNAVLRDSKTIQKEDMRFLIGSALMLAADAAVGGDDGGVPALLWAHRAATSAQVDTEGNILHTVIRLWHEAIGDVVSRIATQLGDVHAEAEGRIHVVVDGTQFRPIPGLPNVSFECMPRADALVLEVSAASILAKCFHDDNIAALVRETLDLDARYGVCSNKGYGTAKHIAGIREHGYTEWHRKSFRIKQLLT